jgi:arabinose-5-phosphate isomerase
MDQKAKDILSYGKNIVGLEAEAVNSVCGLIDSSFESAVKMILSIPSTGRVIVSGIGKAGFIGMKISATLASTGTPSFFLHPAEAVHGDLGRYAKDDIALILSNSGETPEILRILPSIKRVGCPIISITGSKSSTLAKHSEATLLIGKVDEVGPLGLAPTTSTTVMLALGDALAMTVLNQRGFSKEEFAQYHPGGALGRKLMTVAEAMRQGDEHAVARDNLLCKEVIHIISATKGRPGAAAIVNAEGRLVGVFTDGDLRRCLDLNSNFLNEPISEYMGRSPKTCKGSQLVEEALHLMSQFKIDQLLVTDEENHPIGTLDIQDVLSIS